MLPAGISPDYRGLVVAGIAVTENHLESCEKLGPLDLLCAYFSNGLHRGGQWHPDPLRSSWTGVVFRRFIGVGSAVDL